jgi:hypothetical protein
VTESEVRRHTQESIFNSVRLALESGGLLRSASVAGHRVQCLPQSMLEATNQLPIPLTMLLTRLTDQLQQMAGVFGDGIQLRTPDDPTEFTFVGSASAVGEMSPLWLLPSVEILPIAIYA